MKFNYLARNKEGQVQKGVIEASSDEAALNILQNFGFYVTTLEKAKSAPIYARNIKIFSGISPKEIVLLSRQMAIMFQSQVPIIEALDAIVHQSDQPEIKEKISKIREEVEGGAKLSAAFSIYPKIFSPFFISMVKSGEASGKLPEALNYLADHLEQEYNFKSKVKGAMIYPALVVVVFIGVIILLVYWVLPPLMSILQGSGSQLPWSTKMIMVVSGFIRQWGWALILGIGGGAGLFFRYIKSKDGKPVFDKYVLKVPIIGPLLKKIYISRFAENLCTLVSGGLPIAKALEIGGDVVGNDVYKNIILETRDSVRKGEAISAVLQNYPSEFPPLFVQMAVVGEKTGNIENSLQNVVSFYQKEVDRGIETLISLIEPAMLVVMGTGVAFIMISIFLPIYQIGNMAGG